jgi:hypothetical protein
MNETVLSILVVAGLIVLAATVWLATKSKTAKPTAPPQAQPERQQINPEPVQAVGEPCVPGPPLHPPQLLAQLTQSVVTPAADDVPDVQTLLLKAYEQLSTRQHRIESELARIEQLRSEREVVAQQAAALDQAMKAFAATPGNSRQADPHTFKPGGTRNSEAA